MPRRGLVVILSEAAVQAERRISLTEMRTQGRSLGPLVNARAVGMTPKSKWQPLPAGTGQTVPSLTVGRVSVNRWVSDSRLETGDCFLAGIPDQVFSTTSAMNAPHL